MAQDSEVSNLTFDDLIEVNTELLSTIKILKKKIKEIRENQNQAEFERDMLNDEKKILEEELEKVQESYSNSETQLSLLSQEIETQKKKNDVLVSENHELKIKIKHVELENNSL